MTHYLLFRLDDHLFGLNVKNVESVLRAMEILPLPDAPEEVVGLINVRGHILPIFNIRSRLGHLPRDMELSDRILLISGEQPFGIIVDEVLGVVFQKCCFVHSVLLDKIVVSRSMSTSGCCAGFSISNNSETPSILLSPRLKEAGGPSLKGSFPTANHGTMDPEFPRQLGCGLIAADCGKRHLGLEFRFVLFSFRAHNSLHVGVN